MTLLISMTFAIGPTVSAVGPKPAPAPTYTTQDTQRSTNDTGWQIPGDSSCGASEALATASAATSVDTTDAQAANAKAIIGIAKTEKLDKPGALIGLIVGIVESGLKVYANSNVPLSLNNPNKQATGSNFDSLGVFQQRVSQDWSTISNDKNNKATVDQLMNPAYNAEAFFGSPPGSSAPKQLSKGLQNHTDWASKDPWVAAQDTQISAYDGHPRRENNFSSVYGGNYKDALGRAQALLTQYYDSAPAIPLPVPLTGGSATPATSTAADVSSTDSCGGSEDGQGGGAVAGNIVATAMNLAWNDMPNPRPEHGPDSASCYTLDSSGVPQQANPAPNTCYHNYQQRGESLVINGSSHSISPTTYTKSSYQQEYNKYESGVNSTDFTDCGVFVATVMRASGADPNYQQITTGQQLNYVKNNPKYTVYPGFKTTLDLHPGDILLNDGHTYIYLGSTPDITNKTRGWTVAEASQFGHSPEIDANPYPSSDGGNFSVVRLNK